MWFAIKENHVELFIYAKPNAKRSAFIGLIENEIHIALHAKPKDGEANAALISYISELLKVPKSKIKFIRGETSKHKVLSVPSNKTVQQFITDPSQFQTKPT